MIFEYNKISELYRSKDELKAAMRDYSQLQIIIPFEHINVANSNLDIIHDYLQVSFLAENIAKCAKIVNAEKVVRDIYYWGFLITLTPIDLDGLVDTIYSYALFYNDTDDPSSDDIISFNDELQEYESNLENQLYAFPDLIDSYYANLVNASYYEIASEFYDDESDFFREEYRKFPERRFGYWKSAASTIGGGDFYVSKDAWIVPREHSLFDILKKYSGIDQESLFDDAILYDFKGSNIILNEHNAIKFLYGNELLIAIDCAYNALSAQKKDAVLTKKYLMSRYADVLIVQDGEFSYVFFVSNVKLNYTELIELRNSQGSIFHALDSLLGIPNEVKFDWDRLNDESFEQLCYDIIYYNPKFDNATIRKMGKSKSRDGGRDITVMTNRLPEREPELYIFQCKFLLRNTSLTPTKLGHAANVIMQYGAKGYGVFTTGIIDATLYDMLDGFSRNYNISVRNDWSIYEIERYLWQNKNIAARYFL